MRIEISPLIHIPWYFVFARCVILFCRFVYKTICHGRRICKPILLLINRHIGCINVAAMNVTIATPRVKLIYDDLSIEMSTACSNAEQRKHTGVGNGKVTKYLLKFKYFPRYFVNIYATENYFRPQRAMFLCPHLRLSAATRPARFPQRAMFFWPHFRLVVSTSSTFVAYASPLFPQRAGLD